MVYSIVCPMEKITVWVGVLWIERWKWQSCAQSGIESGAFGPKPSALFIINSPLERYTSKTEVRYLGFYQLRLSVEHQEGGNINTPLHSAGCFCLSKDYSEEVTPATGARHY